MVSLDGNLSIYDGPDIKSPPIIKLDQSFNGKTKSFSSSGSHMLVQFVTHNEVTWLGFSAKIHYRPNNPICKDWLNITSGFLSSPDHPTINCSWVITASMGNIISIQFHLFEVLFFNYIVVLNIIYIYLL